MARYLTPAKVGLLVLVDLYGDGVVPSDAILPVLSFISSHLLSHGVTESLLKQPPKETDAGRSVSFVLTIKDFEKLLGSYPFLLGMPGRKLWDQFLEKLWGINSLDAFHSFVDNLSRFLAKSKGELRGLSDGDPLTNPGIKLSRHSILGAFVRRSKIELTRLRWHDSAELWKEFVRFRHPTAEYMKRKTPAFEQCSFDNVLLLGGRDDWSPEGVSALTSVIYGDVLTADNANPLPVSTDDVEKLLEFQIEKMQKHGSRIPVEVRDKFHDLLNDSFVVPSLSHYLNFLDAWKRGDFNAAFDLLHRYFDYTVQNRDRLFYQYALMNLAVLQADFGCYEEAIAAMIETVSTARENRDMTCLNFSLNWLLHFGRAHPELVRDLESDSLLSTGKESIAYMRYRAKETGMWALWSSATLSEAKLCLAQGDSIAGTSALLVRSSQMLVEKNVQSMFGSQLSLVFSIWERLGVIQVSQTTCEVFLRCHAPLCVFDDELKFTCRLASIIAAQGNYEEAQQTLDTLDENCLRSSQSAQYLSKHRGILKLWRDLNRNNLDGAQQLLDQLHQSKLDDLDPDMTFIVDSLQLECFTRRGHLQAAFEKMISMDNRMQDDRQDIYYQVKLLLWKAALLEKSGRLQRGFSIAMRAANLSWRARLMPCLWQAIGIVSNVLISLSEFRFTAQLLISMIPRALETGSSQLVGRLYSTLADAHMGLAGQTEPKSSKRMEYMTAAIRAVEKSFDQFSKLEDVNQQCELVAKKAMIMKLAGDFKLAASYAAAYVELKRNAALE